MKFLPIIVMLTITASTRSFAVSRFQQRRLNFIPRNHQQHLRLIFRRTITTLPYSTTTIPAAASAIDTNEIQQSWDIAGLKKETTRNIARTYKKITKANTKIENAGTEEEEAGFQAELSDLQSRLVALQQIEEQLANKKNKKNVQLEEDLLSMVVQLGLSDSPPVKERGPGKAKGPRAAEKSRLPYRRFYSMNKTEIRVGKQATDNDMLSCMPEYRDSADWWMHASGCPGSHIVIRCHDEELDDDVIMDAASLAARASKCGGANIKVTLTRCRNVSKPPGAKPGLVQIRGSVQTITVNMKEAEGRLERLDSTMLIN